MTTKDNRTVQPYLFFNGQCEEAIGFYRKALGAEVEMIMRYKESPEPPPPGQLPPGFENKIMHASLRIGGTRGMAGGDCSRGRTKLRGFFLAPPAGGRRATRPAVPAPTPGRA